MLLLFAVALEPAGALVLGFASPGPAKDAAPKGSALLSDCVGGRVAGGPVSVGIIPPKEGAGLGAGAPELGAAMLGEAVDGGGSAIVALPNPAVGIADASNPNDTVPGVGGDE